jgi:hypothetical protein
LQGERNLTAPFYLKTASVLTFIHGVLHTIGGVFGAPMPGPMSVAVAAMKGNRFEALGVSRTFWDYHMGEGLFGTLYLTLMAVLCWQLALLAKADPRRARPFIATMAAAMVIGACLAWKYFFAAPAIMELVIAGLLVMAFVVADRPGAAGN